MEGVKLNQWRMRAAARRREGDSRLELSRRGARERAA